MRRLFVATLLILASVSAAAQTCSSVATDNFDDGALGGDWAQMNNGVSHIGIVYSTEVGDLHGGVSAARWVGAGSFNADQCAILTIDNLSNLTDNHLGVLVRATADGTANAANRDYYQLYITIVDGGGPYTTTLAKTVNGTETSIDSDTIAWSVGDEIELYVIGVDPGVFTAKKNGVVIATITGSDSDIDAGAPGVYAAEGSAGAEGSGDDFIGGNASAGGGGGVLVNPISGKGGAAAQPVVQ